MGSSKSESKKLHDVAVVGAGLHPYGKFEDRTYHDLAQTAIRNALESASLEWEQIQAGWCGHTQGGITLGARIFARVGKTGLSVTNVENASASGSYAFRGAWLEVASGQCDVAIALGLDRRSREISPQFVQAGIDAMEAEEGRARRRTGAVAPKGKPEEKTSSGSTFRPFSPIAKFALMAREHMALYGTTIDQLAQVSVKQHANASLNEYAQYRKPVTIDEVHRARMLVEPFTVLHSCPFGDGAAAVILMSESAVERHGVTNPVWVRASISSSQKGDDDLDVTTEKTAQLAYEISGIGPDEIGMIELHDAFTIEEIIYTESLGLCPRGEGGKLVESGSTSLTGRVPVNASGGLLAMGHPFGPTGIGQIAEIFWQLRGEAGNRQIPSRPETGLAHMVGMGGTCIIHIFSV